MALRLGCELYSEGISDLIILHRRGLPNIDLVGDFFIFLAYV